MKISKLNKITNKNGIDKKSLNKEDVNTLFEHYVKGDFEAKEFTNFMKDANTSYQTFISGLNSFMEKSNYSSNKYTDSLKGLIDDLNIQHKEVETREEKDQIWSKIETILNLMREETAAGRDLLKTFGVLAAGVGVVVIGGAVAIATKNPELLKKGMEIIGKETVKSATKIG